jgi:hydroxyethylthiazole kinase-like sugar kinase family protein
LTSEQAIDLLKSAVEKAKAANLPWNSDPVELSPSEDLVEMVLRSRERGDDEQDEEEE